MTSSETFSDSIFLSASTIASTDPCVSALTTTLRALLWAAWSVANRFSSVTLGGAPVPFLNAAAHGVLFYLSWMFPLVFLVTLVDADKRFLHDILSGVWVLRRR